MFLDRIVRKYKVKNTISIVTSLLRIDEEEWSFTLKYLILLLHFLKSEIYRTEIPLISVERARAVAT